MDIALATGCFFPNTELAFRMAADHGYDGVELMVNHERRSQTAESICNLVAEFGVPVLSVHVPCLVITQHVWGWNPETKLRRTVELAEQVGAKTVVVHPPFLWQRDYASSFGDLVTELDRPDRRVTVENMYGFDALGRQVAAYLGATDEDFAAYDAVTLDSSHAGADRRDLLELYGLLRSQIRHLHLSDSTSSKGDEHLPPGSGSLPLEALAAAMVRDGFEGTVVVEVAIGRQPEAMRGDLTAECRAWAEAAFRP